MYDSHETVTVGPRQVLESDRRYLKDCNQVESNNCAYLPLPKECGRWSHTKACFLFLENDFVLSFCLFLSYSAPIPVNYDIKCKATLDEEKCEYRVTEIANPEKECEVNMWIL